MANLASTQNALRPGWGSLTPQQQGIMSVGSAGLFPWLMGGSRTLAGGVRDAAGAVAGAPPGQTPPNRRPQPGNRAATIAQGGASVPYMAATLGGGR
jgi:hypothetical protein